MKRLTNLNLKTFLEDLGFQPIKGKLISYDSGLIIYTFPNTKDIIYIEIINNPKDQYFQNNMMFGLNVDLNISPTIVKPCRFENFTYYFIKVDHDIKKFLLIVLYLKSGITLQPIK